MGPDAEVARRAAEIAARHIAPLADQLDRSGEFPKASFATLARAGLLGISVPEVFGGLGADTLSVAAALQEVASVCASTAVGMSVSNMVAETIDRFGSEALKQRYLPMLTSGDAVVGAFCLSEPGSGSDAASLSTTARREGDDWVLDGTKMWISSGAFAQVLIVMARTGDEPGHKGISAFVVEPSMAGFAVGRAEHKTGLLGSNTVAILLDGCRVPAGNLLGVLGGGFRIAMTALDGGRITIGAMANGIARGALAAARDYMDGHAGVGADPGLQALYGQLLARTCAAELMVRRAAGLKVANLAGGPRFTREAAMAKLFATENAKQVTREVIRILGEDGLQRSHGVERLMRDARVTTIFEGTSEIQRVVIAREVMAGSS